MNKFDGNLFILIWTGRFMGVKYLRVAGLGFWGIGTEPVTHSDQ